MRRFYSNNNPLPYVSFSTETNLGTISNSDGRIVLKYPKSLARTELYISSIGYKLIFILPENDKDDMIFLLKPDTFSINEVKVLPLDADEIINQLSIIFQIIFMIQLFLWIFFIANRIIKCL